MAENNICPICFSPIGRWTNDPILTVNGIPGFIPLIDSISYQGFIPIHKQHLQELQEARKAQEIELNILPRTQFTSIPYNIQGENAYFLLHINHIKELRESTEKILDSLEITKKEYFNNDEDENIIRNPGDLGYHEDWHDSQLTGHQIKHIHIEDLRHPIILGWRETFDKTVGFPSHELHYTGGLIALSKQKFYNFDHTWKYYAGIPVSGVGWKTHTNTEETVGFEIIGDSNNKQYKGYGDTSIIYGDSGGGIDFGGYSTQNFIYPDIASFSHMLKITNNTKIITLGSISFSSSQHTDDYNHGMIRLHLKNIETEDDFYFFYHSGYGFDHQIEEIEVPNLFNMERTLSTDIGKDLSEYYIDQILVRWDMGVTKNLNFSPLKTWVGNYEFQIDYIKLQ